MYGEDSPQIRHSGSASIRGKIRRVWRPRFLELLDNRFLCYYELPSIPADGGDSSGLTYDEDAILNPHLEVRSLPKYTLRVFSARILDMTTLRDMHVGLPQGSFGFVFRGQHQQFLSAEEDPLELGWNTNDVDLGQKAGGGKSPSLSTLLNNSQCAPQVQEPRDFLCAVATLEDAQMWVVALQWAALQSNQQRTIPSAKPWWSVEGEEWVGTESVMPPASFTTDSYSEGVQQDLKLGLAPQHLNKPQKISRQPDASSHPSVPKQRSDTSASGKCKPGNIVVTRVVDSRLVRLQSARTERYVTLPILSWIVAHFDIAYEIHVLVIQNETIEKFVVLRTGHDLSLLLQALPGSPPRLVHLCQQLSSNVRDLAKNISVVDSIVRSLVMDIALVNTPSLKHFLGLQYSCSGVDSPLIYMRRESIWNIHDSIAILLRSQSVLHGAPEEFVRTWLQERHNWSRAQDISILESRALKIYQCLLVSSHDPVTKRQVTLTATACSLSCVLVPVYARQVSHMMPRIHIRLDVLLGSLAAAYYFGNLYDKQKPHLEARPTVRRSSVSAESLRRQAEIGSVSGSASTVEESSHGASVGSSNPLDSNREITSEALMGDDEEESDGEEASDEDVPYQLKFQSKLGSPLPEYPDNQGMCCWSKPPNDIFFVRGPNYLVDKVKIPSNPGPLTCRGVDVWITDNPQRHIARHPSVLGGELAEQDTFLVNFLLPFGNFVSYFGIPSLDEFPDKLRTGWINFLRGDQQYRDARLKLLPVVMDGPWIVKTAVGGGKSPALLGKVIPLQYFFRDPDDDRKGVYEVDVIITASTIAKGILSVVKGHTKSVSIAFAVIIEASQANELPETVLCSFQVNQLCLEECPILPECDMQEDFPTF